ncbi:MAG: prepilin-type N-terminal cleavage/methylation domain-containing protein [Candidatus Pacebacteria bacterium]|nr:prepilin-type N-terminal cleavage/methylation domain-containing protein [Candidatus Paceibacterota bacterium]
MNKSFTLIELLVVIVIIGILAGVIIVSTSSSINKANLAKAQSFSNTVQNELLLNLVSEWTFDEGGAEDTWGNNDGTVSGATYVSKSENRCVYGGCYLFNLGDYITCGNNKELDLTKEITVTAWVHLSSHGELYHIISKYQSASYGTWYLSTGSNNIKKLRYTFIDENMVYRSGESSKDIPLNEWVFIGWSFDNGITKLYIDGYEESFGNYNVNMVSNSVNAVINIGRQTMNNGLMDDIRIYNAALTTAQIKQEYVAGLNSLLANGNILKEDYNQKIKEIGLTY